MIKRKVFIITITKEEMLFLKQGLSIFSKQLSQKSSKPNLDEIDEKWLDYGVFEPIHKPILEKD